MSSGSKPKIEVLHSNSNCVLVKVCVIDDSGNEDSVWYLVFEIPGWNLIKRSQAQAEAEECYNKISNKPRPTEDEYSMPNEEALRADESQRASDNLTVKGAPT